MTLNHFDQQRFPSPPKRQHIKNRKLLYPLLCWLSKKVKQPKGFSCYMLSNRMFHLCLWDGKIILPQRKTWMFEHLRNSCSPYHDMNVWTMNISETHVYSPTFPSHSLMHSHSHGVTLSSLVIFLDFSTKRNEGNAPWKGFGQMRSD